MGTTPRDLYSNRKASIVKDLMLQDKVLNEYIQRSKNTNWSEDDRDDVEFRELQTVEAGVLKEQPNQVMLLEVMFILLVMMMRSSLMLG